MQECTNKELRTARETAKLARWQVAQELGVSESTVRDWENGTTRPEPDDVFRLGQLLKAPKLWHLWMRSHYESYRDTWPETPSLSLPLAVVNVRHALADLAELQDKAERDALDGHMDNPAIRDAYAQELTDAQAAIAEALSQIREEPA